MQKNSRSRFEAFHRRRKKGQKRGEEGKNEDKEDGGGFEAEQERSGAELSIGKKPLSNSFLLICQYLKRATATTTDPTTNTRTAADDDFYYYRCDRLPMLLYFFIFLLISFEYKGRNSADRLTIVGEKNSTI